MGTNRLALLPSPSTRIIFYSFVIVVAAHQFLFNKEQFKLFERGDFHSKDTNKQNKQIKLLTDFTVLLMKSFLWDRSNDGYFAYTCLQTVFIVISSKFASSKISLT